MLTEVLVLPTGLFVTEIPAGARGIGFTVEVFSTFAFLSTAASSQVVKGQTVAQVLLP